MTNTKDPGNDIVVRRLYARGTWKLRSVAHFGGDDTGIADMSLLYDANGNPFIPGASIAGAARSFLARQRQPWAKYKEKNEGKSIKRFFGGDMRQNREESERNKDTMSALIVDDAVCIDKQAKTSVRDGVSIDHASGIAVTGAKFDVEVVERGTEFELNFECIIRQGDDPLGLKDEKKKPNLEELFLALLHAFEQGDIRLGARTRRGYGRGKVESWDIRDLQMKDQADVMAWLRGDPWSRPALNNLSPCPLSSTDRREYLRIEADFKLRTSLLIRSSSGDPKAPDMVHLQSAGKSVVPGTSFAGAFRHRATLIAKTIGFPESWVDKIFGYVHERKGKVGQQADARASRVRIEERVVKRVELQWQDRVAIDRFTGGSLEGALFNEKPAYPLSFKNLPNKQKRPNLRLRLTLEEPDEAEIGLLLLTLRDFWYGHAALGGETSNGRGTLQGIKARLLLKSSESSDVKVWKFSDKDNRMKCDDGDVACLESYVNKFHEYMKCRTDPPQPEEEETVNA